MQVITTCFSIENPRRIFDSELDGAPNDPIPPAANDATNTYREWLGTHEGENRVALREKSMPSRKRVHRKTDLKVLFAVFLVD